MIKRLAGLSLALALAATPIHAHPSTPAPPASDDGAHGEHRHGMEEGAEDEAGMFAWFGDDGDGLDADGAGGGEVHRMIVREHAGGPRMGRGMRGRGAHRGMHGRAMARLDLTDAQRERMRALHVAHRRKAIQAKADLQLARLDLHQMMQQDKPQKAAIDAQIDRIARLRADLHKSRVATHLEAHALLTPEQQKQLRELRQGGAKGPDAKAAPGTRRMIHRMDGPGSH